MRRRGSFDVLTPSLLALVSVAWFSACSRSAPPESTPPRVTAPVAGATMPDCPGSPVERLPTLDHTPFAYPGRESLRDPERPRLGRARRVSLSSSVETLEAYARRLPPGTPEWAETVRAVAVRYAVLAWDAERRLWASEAGPDAPATWRELCALRRRTIAHQTRVVEQLVEPARTREPWMPRSVYALALELERAGRFEAAEAEYLRLLDSFPESELAALARLGLAEVGAERAGPAIWPESVLGGYAALFESANVPAAVRVYAGYALVHAADRRRDCAAAERAMSAVTRLLESEPAAGPTPEQLAALWQSHAGHCTSPRL